MRLDLVAGSWLLGWVALSHADAELDPASVADSLAENDECRETGGESAQCSVNALQFRAKSQKVDLESSEGADLIEAAREMYGVYDWERDLSESGYNHTWSGSCAAYGCVGFDRNHDCQCNAECVQYNSCCADYNDKCANGQASAPPGSTPTPREFTSARDGIPPPHSPFQYNGMSWPAMRVGGIPGQKHHVFAIGDWGGMDGSFKPPDGFPQMIAYTGGHLPGPHVFPRSRLKCKHDALVKCYFKGKKYCDPSCGFAPGIDDNAQILVAEQFKRRAAMHDPKFILNVGDNFYWGGITKNCGYQMNEIHWATRHQFTNVFEGVYSGHGIDGKPWLSVLGNHDWGGRMFSAGWDQQIAYTWASDRWRMPAAYWHQFVHFPDFTMDIYMVDSNFNDAEPMHKDIEHNICGSHNRRGATCASAGGPSSIYDCVSWFHNLWHKQQDWLREKLTASTATWQVVVTHFPCDHSASFWRELNEKYGLDLLVTGHRHDQELWKANQQGYTGMLGGLTCFVTGGGGGISSEESPLHGKPTHHWPNVNTQYGFFDLTVSKDEILVESIDYRGNVLDTTIVQPTDRA